MSVLCCDTVPQDRTADAGDQELELLALDCAEHLDCSEQQMPDRVYQGVHDGGREDAARLAPCAAVEKSCNDGEQDVPPVREYAVIGDVGEAENYRRCDPASGLV